MTSIGLIADGLLIVLLGVALVSVHRLNRRMGELREGRTVFEKLTADLAKQTEAAAESVAALRRTAETVGKQLDTGTERGRQVIAEVQHASDDLRLLIGRADASSGRLEAVIAQSRRAEAWSAAQAETTVQRRPIEPAPEVAEPASPEAAAFLSSLSGMR
jgi:hypothetical protein